MQIPAGRFLFRRFSRFSGLGTNPSIPERIEEKHAHIIGSGIAGLAAAVYLVQDAKMPGKNITIYEARPNLGGCLEAFGSAEDGYLSTGAREPEPYFQCMGITASSEFS